MGVVGVGVGAGDLTLPPPSPPPTPMHTHTHIHTHTHKLMCFLYFRHIEANACKTTNRSIHINSHNEGAMPT